MKTANLDRFTSRFIYRPLSLYIATLCLYQSASSWVVVVISLAGFLSPQMTYFFTSHAKMTYQTVLQERKPPFVTSCSDF